MHRIIGRLELCTYPTYPTGSTFHILSFVLRRFSSRALLWELLLWRLDLVGEVVSGGQSLRGIGYYEPGL